MYKTSTISSYQTSFKVNKRKEASRTSASPDADTKSPSRATPSATPDKGQKNNGSIHKWAKQSHRSLVFSLGKNNDLTAKKKDVPGTSIIRISHRKDKYVYPKNETIKFPQISGTKMFGPERIVIQSPSTKATTKSEFILTRMDQMCSIAKIGSSSEESGVMNVKPYTNHDPGVLSKFSLQENTARTSSLPGTSILFPTTEYVSPLESRPKPLQPIVSPSSIRLDDQSSKNWQVLTVTSDQ